MSTRIYGLFQFNPRGNLQAIRHMITPSFSLSYQPELGIPMNGWRTLKYTNSKGEEVTKDYNIYAGQLNSPPGKGRNGSMSFSFGNNLEAKVKDTKDTTGVGTKKIKLIDQLTIGGSYNFLADSLRMSNIGVSVSTNLFGKLNFSGNLNFDPYAINERGQKINKFNVHLQGDELNIICNTTNDCSFEKWSFDHRSDLFEEVIGIKAILKVRRQV